MKHYVNGRRAASKAILTVTLRQIDECLHLFAHLDGFGQAAVASSLSKLSPSTIFPLCPPGTFPPWLSPSLTPSNSSLYALAFFIPVAEPWLPLARRTPSLFSKSRLSDMQQRQGSVRCSSPAGLPANHCFPTLLQTPALSDHAIHERTCHSFIHSLPHYHCLSIVKPLSPFIECSCTCLPSCSALHHVGLQ